jgi:hypothetical protein
LKTTRTFNRISATIARHTQAVERQLVTALAD